MRILLFFIYLLVGAMGAFLLLLIISALLVDGSREYDRHSAYYRRLLNISTALMLFFGRIHLHVSGMEKLPRTGRFLLASNHRSKMDPLTTWYIFRKFDVAFISKAENFHVPVFGRLIRKCCFMEIDREDPRKALSTINRAVRLLKSDEVSVGVYPEGTRNFGDGLLPFHNGVFKIAQRANVPIVVLAISGAEQIRKNYPLHRSHVEMTVVGTISAEKAAATRSVELGDLIRDMLLRKSYEGERENDNVCTV